MNRQKGIAPILIILLIAVSVGGYLIYQRQIKSTVVTQQITQPSPSLITTSEATNSADIINWKTYEDSENGFSFKYPNNWNIDNSYKSVNGSIRFFKVGDEVSYTYMMAKGNEELILLLKNDQSFDDLKRSYKLDNPPIIIQGKQALRYATGIYILLDSKQNRILSFYRPQYPDEGYLDQILSTIKFLKVNQSNKIVDWKEYTNTKYGYSVQYPSNWIDAGHFEGDWYDGQYFANSKREGLYIYDVTITVVKSVGPYWSSVKDYFEKEIEAKKPVTGPKAKITYLGNIIINGEVGIRRIEETTPGSGTENGYSDNVYIYKNNYLYHITSTGSDRQSVEKNKEIFAKILSTFKFE